MNNNKLKIWVVYDQRSCCLRHRPLDFPEKYVARLFLNNEPTQEIIVNDDLEKIRNQMRLNGLTKISRHQSDPLSLIESWL